LIDGFRFVVATLNDALAFHYSGREPIVVGVPLAILGTVEVGSSGRRNER
jgi:hypothetical protein